MQEVSQKYREQTEGALGLSRENRAESHLCGSLWGRSQQNPPLAESPPAQGVSKKQ